MSYPYFVDHGAGADPHDLEYSVYDPRYVHTPGGPLTASPHLDSGGFWYRADQLEPQYSGSGNSEYGRGMHMSINEHIKHRRTRSGCFTCRSRRVKCDETRPMCDRCRKGNRQCDFPPPASSSSKKHKNTDSRTRSARSPGTDREEKETSPVTGLQTIKDESEDEALPSELPQSRPRLDRLRTNSTQSLTRKQKWRQHSEASAASSTTKEKATTPSTDTSSSHSRSETPSSSLQMNPPLSTTISRASRWIDRRADIQKYLLYHDAHITFYHYFLKFDGEDFIHTELIDLALTYEPLLYAVVAFSAYHHTLKQPEGQITTFITYYSKSINLLIKSLSKGAEPTQATLLAVLQLTTLEEYLGDWVNLVGHHRAAHHMLIKLYTPANIMDTEANRQILAWYARFDVVAGLMSVNETVLDRSWYTACSSWYDERIDTEDLDIDYSLQYVVAENRLIGMDMAALFSKLAKGALDLPTFKTENALLTSSLRTLKSRIESLNDGYYTVKEFPYRIPLTSADIVNPYIPGGLFRGAFWPLNYAWCDFYGIHEMHEYQTSVVLGVDSAADLEHISLEQCRIFEAIDRYPDAPQGSTLAAHTSLGLASVFLKKDDRHIMWARRKLARVEREGYVFPPTFRQKMALLWGVPEVEDWWLPDHEGYLPILREIRKLIDDRVKTGREAGRDGGDDLRDIKAVFSRMNMGGGEEGSPGSASSGRVEGLTPPSGGLGAVTGIGIGTATALGSAAAAPPVTAGAMAKEAGVTGLLKGIWPESDGPGQAQAQAQGDINSEGPRSTAASDSGGNLNASVETTRSVMTLPATPADNPTLVQRRRRSQGQLSRQQAQQQAMDRMSWISGSLS